ncbi:hypothetical protein MRY87_11020, partial [bacterium]|nr:hypothetical protein [bacterium]
MLPSPDQGRRADRISSSPAEARTTIAPNELCEEIREKLSAFIFQEEEIVRPAEFLGEGTEQRAPHEELAIQWMCSRVEELDLDEITTLQSRFRRTIGERILTEHVITPCEFEDYEDIRGDILGFLPPSEDFSQSEHFARLNAQFEEASEHLKRLQEMLVSLEGRGEEVNETLQVVDSHLTEISERDQAFYRICWFEIHWKKIEEALIEAEVLLEAKEKSGARQE